MTWSSEPDRPAQRRGPILAAIVAAALLASAIVALLLLASLKTPTHQHVLVVRSSADWDGVELIVEGDRLAGPKSTHIEKLGNYMVPFFLPAGQYTLRVIDQGQQIYTKQIKLTTVEVEEIDLTRVRGIVRPATRPTSQPATVSWLDASPDRVYARRLP
jgi:hypothetical protein